MLQENLAILNPSQKERPLLPPMVCETLWKMLTTYAAKLWMLWGKKCAHYILVLTVVKILYQEEMESSADNFTPMLCEQITCAVIEDSRWFFYKKMQKKDFIPGIRPKFQASTLVWVNVHTLYQQEIKPTNHLLVKCLSSCLF